MSHLTHHCNTVSFLAVQFQINLSYATPLNSFFRFARYGGSNSPTCIEHGVNRKFQMAIYLLRSTEIRAKQQCMLCLFATHYQQAK